MDEGWIRRVDDTFYVASLVAMLYVVHMGGRRIAFRFCAMLATVFAIKFATGKRSFPSGHAAVAAFVANAPFWTSAVVRLSAWGWAVAVAGARVLLKKQDAFDVVVGLGIGAMAVMV
jgi:membrane-associated phospholipid phosphatase